MKTKIYLCTGLLVVALTAILWRHACHQPSSTVPDAPPSALSPKSAAAQVVNKHIEGEDSPQSTLARNAPDQQATIKKLQEIALQPIAESEKDPRYAGRQYSAMRHLAIMRVPEATAALAQLLYQPPEKHFLSGTTPEGSTWYSLSHQLFYLLNETVKGAPPPTNKHVYTVEDIPAFRNWWETVKANPPYKDIPVEDHKK